MFSLKDLEKKKHVPKGTSIKPGSYYAEVIDVLDSDKYVDGTAFLVRYRLYQKDGTFAGNFEELFFNSTSNRRTLELAELMEKLCIEDADDLIGITVEVVIRFRVASYGKTFPSIISRTPISPSSTSLSSSAEEAP